MYYQWEFVKLKLLPLVYTRQKIGYFILKEVNWSLYEKQLKYWMAPVKQKD